MNQEVKVVELVLPEGMKAAAVAPPPGSPGGSSWLIPTLVGVVLVGNAVLVWCRIRGRDPLKQAFRGAAARIGLSRGERRRIEELAGEGVAPVTMLVCESALEAAGGDDPLVVSVRAKLKRAGV